MLRVLVFTDEPVAAEGLESLLRKSGGFRVVVAPSNPGALVDTARTVRPDLLLLDMTPDLTYGVMVELQEAIPGCRIVVWVRNISKELAYQAIEHGIRGILRKTLPSEAVVKCLRMVAEGGLWFEESLKDGFLGVKAVSLSRRESQLVNLLARGLKNKEIASVLLISDGTVKVYLSRLFKKLGVKDRFELALFGLRNMPEAELTFGSAPQRAETLRGSRQGVQSEWLRSLLLDRPEARAGNIAS